MWIFSRSFTVRTKQTSAMGTKLGNFIKESTDKRYFDGLREHRKDIKDYTITEFERFNEREVVDGNYSSEKLKKLMSQEEKNMVHNEVDLKMQELEDTGLTRMEILYDQDKGIYICFTHILGIPLADDPVFQYLKVNRIAREMLIKDNEPFIAETVVDKALRQDLEPDPSLSRK